MFRVEFVKYKFNFFTFQSGSIQIVTAGMPLSGGTNFTFQSGSIQIRIKKQIVYVPISLHSNLVLFK